MSLTATLSAREYFQMIETMPSELPHPPPKWALDMSIVMCALFIPVVYLAGAKQGHITMAVLGAFATVGLRLIQVERSSPLERIFGAPRRARDSGVPRRLSSTHEGANKLSRYGCHAARGDRGRRRSRGVAVARRREADVRLSWCARCEREMPWREAGARPDRARTPTRLRRCEG